MVRSKLIVGIVLLLIVIALTFYFVQNDNFSIREEKNQSIVERYPVLNNSQFYSAELELNESMLIKNVDVSYNLTTGNFRCNGKEIQPILVSSVSSPYPLTGGWGSIYIIDCKKFYLVYSFSDAGPRAFGPFTN